MGKLDGKVAIITGAASGMGRATAVRFAKEGAAVVVADLNSQAGEQVIAEITAAGGRAVFQNTDVGSDRDLKALFDRALKEYGRLDITFNNAGLGGATGRLVDITPEDWDRTFESALFTAESKSAKKLWLSINAGPPSIRYATPSTWIWRVWQAAQVKPTIRTPRSLLMAKPTASPGVGLAGFGRKPYRARLFSRNGEPLGCFSADMQDWGIS
jgi:NAD(P)-dependent dehydrogenase (short-subunit alcohol dehydrogenase family)